MHAAGTWKLSRGAVPAGTQSSTLGCEWQTFAVPLTVVLFGERYFGTPSFCHYGGGHDVLHVCVERRIVCVYFKNTSRTVWRSRAHAELAAGLGVSRVSWMPDEMVGAERWGGFPLEATGRNSRSSPLPQGPSVPGALAGDCCLQW